MLLTVDSVLDDVAFAIWPVSAASMGWELSLVNSETRDGEHVDWKSTPMGKVISPVSSSTAEDMLTEASSKTLSNSPWDARPWSIDDGLCDGGSGPHSAFSANGALRPWPGRPTMGGSRTRSGSSARVLRGHGRCAASSKRDHALGRVVVSMAGNAKEDWLVAILRFWLEDLGGEKEQRLDRTSLRMSSRTCRRSKMDQFSLRGQQGEWLQGRWREGRPGPGGGKRGRREALPQLVWRLQGAMKSVRPGGFGDFLEAHLWLMRLRPDYDDVIQLPTLWGDLDGEGRLWNA